MQGHLDKGKAVVDSENIDFKSSINKYLKEDTLCRRNES